MPNNRFDYKYNANGKICGVVDRHAERVVRRVTCASQVANAMRTDDAAWTLPSPEGGMRVDSASTPRPVVTSAQIARTIMLQRTDSRPASSPVNVTSASAARLAMLQRGGR